MPRVMEQIKTLNSLLRTLLLVGIVAVLGLAGYWGYTNYVRPSMQLEQTQQELEEKSRQLVELRRAYDQQQEQINQLETAIKLLKVDRRLAQIKVLDKGTDGGDQVPYLDVEFVEVDPAGNRIGQPRRFHLQGDKLYVDCWVVKFEDQYVEKAEPLRAASLCIFKSIWGNLDGPEGGHALDRSDQDDPTAYGSGAEMSEFEKQIWDDFWTVSNSPQKQSDLGIRASHGQVNYMFVQPGTVYQVDLRASDGLSIRALDEPPIPSGRPSR